MQIKDVNIVHVVINEHGPIFQELIALMMDCLQGNGVQVSRTINQIRPDRLNVIVGHTMFLTPETYPRIRNQTRDYILFQFEALDGTQGFSSNYPAYFEFLRAAKQVWEYSPQNMRYLAQLGVTNVRYIPVGYSRHLELIPDRGEQDIDILLFGATADRRKKIVEELRRRGFKAELLFGAYGAVRDSYIARTKVQLNIHQFETSQLEQLRLSYLLNNKRFVVSEATADNPYGDGVVFCKYEEIVERCEYYLKPGMDLERKRIAELGYDHLKRIPTARSMIDALAELVPNESSEP